MLLDELGWIVAAIPPVSGVRNLASTERFRTTHLDPGEEPADDPSSHSSIPHFSEHPRLPTCSNLPDLDVFAIRVRVIPPSGQAYLLRCERIALPEFERLPFAARYSFGAENSNHDST